MFDLLKLWLIPFLKFKVSFEKMMWFAKKKSIRNISNMRFCEKEQMKFEENERHIITTKMKADVRLIAWRSRNVRSWGQSHPSVYGGRGGAFHCLMEYAPTRIWARQSKVVACVVLLTSALSADARTRGHAIRPEDLAARQKRRCDASSEAATLLPSRLSLVTR